jgi:threonine/homoserine/homoserine lactone efflux protein
MFGWIAQGITFGYAAGVTPGPLQLFMLTQTLRFGWRHTIWLALSPLISDGPIVALILLVLQEASDGLLRAMSAVGGAFILYLAWGLYQQIRAGTFVQALMTGEIADADAAEPVPETESPWAGLRKAIAINALGPGPWLFWSTAMGPLAIEAWREAHVNAVGFVVGFYATFLLVMVGLILLFHQARRLGPRVVGGGLWVALGVMILFALQLWRGALFG